MLGFQVGHALKLFIIVFRLWQKRAGQLSQPTPARDARAISTCGLLTHFHFVHNQIAISEAIIGSLGLGMQQAKPCEVRAVITLLLVPALSSRRGRSCSIPSEIVIITTDSAIAFKFQTLSHP